MRASGRLHFNTDSLPERDRMAIWREEYGRTLVRLDFEPVPGRPVRENAVLHVLPGLGIVANRTDGHYAHRSQALLADGKDDFIFTVNKTGRSRVSQFGRETAIEAGEASMVHCADTGFQHFAGSAEYFCLAVPAKAMRALLPDPESAVLRSVRRDDAALRMLVRYVDIASEPGMLETPELQHLFVTHTHDLIALALGAPADVAEMAKIRGLSAARLQVIKRDIVGSLSQQDLSVVDVAARYGITPRYLQMLFEADGTTFSEFVAGQRLAWAHCMLSYPRFAGYTVSAIAFKAGFGDLSHFNRSFRRTYGATPSDVREEARKKNEN